MRYGAVDQVVRPPVTNGADGVEPGNDVPPGVQQGEVDIALSTGLLRTPRSKLLVPDVSNRFRDVRIIAMPGPGCDHKRSQFRNDARIAQRGPTDLRGRRSAVARRQVAVFRMDDHQADRTTFAGSTFPGRLER